MAASLVAGAVVAARVRLPERAAVTLSAFGRGVLLAAVALELVPDADAEAGTALTALGLVAGTLVYVGADAWLSRRESGREIRRAMHAAAGGRTGPAEEMMRSESARGLSIAAGLTIDGIPESLALGLTIAEDEPGVALLAGIVIGNVVESYGAAQPIIAGGRFSAAWVPRRPAWRMTTGQVAGGPLADLALLAPRGRGRGDGPNDFHVNKTFAG